jgi:hypothetical protein
MRAVALNFCAKAVAPPATSALRKLGLPHLRTTMRNPGKPGCGWKGHCYRYASSTTGVCL